MKILAKEQSGHVILSAPAVVFDLNYSSNVERKTEMPGYQAIYHPEHGYEIITPERVCQLTLVEIETFTPQQISWLTRNYDGLELPGREDVCRKARAYLHEIGYRPRRETPEPPPR